MIITKQEVQGFYRNKIPEENETIYDDIKITASEIADFCIYRREKNQDNIGRGCWVTDYKLKNGMFFCIKYPLEMTKEHILRFHKPLLDDIDRLKRDNKEKMN